MKANIEQKIKADDHLENDSKEAFKLLQRSAHSGGNNCFTFGFAFRGYKIIIITFKITFTQSLPLYLNRHNQFLQLQIRISISLKIIYKLLKREDFQ